MTDDQQELKPSEDAASEEPHIYAVKRNGKNGLSRREFLQISTVSALAASLAGCDALSKGVDEIMNGGEARPTVTNRPSDTPQPTHTPQPTDTPQPTATATPTRTPTNSPTATAITFDATVRTNGTNVRSGPGTYYTRVAQVDSGDIVTLIGRLDDSSWFQVFTPLHVLGWMRADLINHNNQPVDTLPVVEAPPTPTPMPGREGTTRAGETGIDYEYTDIYGNVYTFTLPCGSPIPPGAVCICNCVTVPVACTCHTICTCDSESHYWYPN